MNNTEKWWRSNIVYQIYPRSFQDTNGDGFGDIPGIIMHLDELKDLGVGIIWLSPLYCSPDADNGYDISDYCNIDPKYGTMKDMEVLIAQAKERGIRIVMDLVVNHTSDEHEWFKKSREKDPKYKDYYIWRKGGDNGAPPNNWTGFFSEGAWTYDETRGEYYLHLFDKKQPDLNYENPQVRREVKDLIAFWLDKGVGGFRCDVINVISKTTLADGKKQLALVGMEHFVNQPGMHEFLQELRREVLSKYDCFTVGETCFVGIKEGKELTDESRGELDMIFQFKHMEVDCFYVKYFHRAFSPKRFAKVLAEWQGALEWNANYFENHDQPRSVSRFGNDGEYWEQSAKMLATMLLTLRGTPYIYQGQEIGMTNYPFGSIDELNDVESRNVYKMTTTRMHFPKWLAWKMIKNVTRDHARTPMQWNDSENGGFTTGKPWLSVNPNYKKINYAAEKKDPFSVRNYYKDMIAIRNSSDTLMYGKFKLLVAKNSYIAYERSLDGKRAVVLLNFSPRSVRAPFAGQVVISSAGTEEFKGVLQPYEGIVLNEGTRV